ARVLWGLLLPEARPRICSGETPSSQPPLVPPPSGAGLSCVVELLLQPTKQSRGKNATKASRHNGVPLRPVRGAFIGAPSIAEESSVVSRASGTRRLFVQPVQPLPSRPRSVTAFGPTFTSGRGFQPLSLFRRENHVLDAILNRLDDRQPVFSVESSKIVFLVGDRGLRDVLVRGTVLLELVLEVQIGRLALLVFESPAVHEKNTDHAPAPSPQHAGDLGQIILHFRRD